MLARQRDVEADRFRVDIRRPAVGGFHNAGPAAGDDDVVATPVDLACGRHDSTEFSGDVIILGELELAFGDGNCLPASRVIWHAGCLRFGFMKRLFRRGGLMQSGTAEYYDGRLYVFLALNQLGFQQFEPDSNRAKFVPF